MVNVYRNHRMFTLRLLNQTFQLLFLLWHCLEVPKHIKGKSERLASDLWLLVYIYCPYFFTTGCNLNYFSQTHKFVSYLLRPMWYWNGLNDFNIVNMKLLIQISNLGFFETFSGCYSLMKDLCRGNLPTPNLMDLGSTRCHLKSMSTVKLVNWDRYIIFIIEFATI